MKKRQRRIPICYLKMQRRNWGLTQKELAGLLAVNETSISCYEHGKRSPNLGTALACQAIFGVPPSAMFPDTYTLVEEEVMRNMARMDLALANNTDPAGLRKRELFSLALARVIGTSSNKMDA